jgi:hypothetical protein
MVKHKHAIAIVFFIFMVLSISLPLTAQMVEVFGEVRSHVDAHNIRRASAGTCCPAGRMQKRHPDTAYRIRRTARTRVARKLTSCGTTRRPLVEFRPDFWPLTSDAEFDGRVGCMASLGKMRRHRLMEPMLQFRIRKQARDLDGWQICKLGGVPVVALAIQERQKKRGVPRLHAKTCGLGTPFPRSALFL